MERVPVESGPKMRRLMLSGYTSEAQNGPPWPVASSQRHPDRLQVAWVFENPPLSLSLQITSDRDGLALVMRDDCFMIHRGGQGRPDRHGLPIDERLQYYPLFARSRLASSATTKASSVSYDVSI